MQTEIVDYFAGYIKEQLGIVFDKSNYYQLETRLNELAKSEGCKDIFEFYNKAKLGLFGKTKQKLLDIATNNETSFFRDPKIFSKLETDIFPDFKKRGINNIRIWCAASSFGQEVYSLLMLHNELPLQSKPTISEFIATDISERALKKASEGIYTHLEVGRGLTPELQKKYFTQVQNPQAAIQNSLPQPQWQVNNELRRKIDFRSQNILAPFSHLGKFDLILCRNILIYQNIESKKNIVDRLYEQLNDHGALVMGVGESMIGISQKFESFSKDTVSVYKKIPQSQLKKAI